MKDRLVWHEEGRKAMFSCPIFTVEERYCRSPAGKLKTFSVLDTSDWAIIIPAIDTERGREFVMVQQWRHGSKELSIEFPGGVFEKGEDPVAAAARELKEETGYSAGIMKKLGEFNPNPAIMSNNVHFFLALDLCDPVKQELDEDEYVEVKNVPWEEVLEGMGKAPYSHALMAAAMALYLKSEK